MFLGRCCRRGLSVLLVRTLFLSTDTMVSVLKNWATFWCPYLTPPEDVTFLTFLDVHSGVQMSGKSDEAVEAAQKKTVPADWTLMPPPARSGRRRPSWRCSPWRWEKTSPWGPRKSWGQEGERACWRWGWCRGHGGEHDRNSVTA